MYANLRKATKLASCAIIAVAASTAGANAYVLSNGSLAVDIRNDNGAIDTVTFGGSDFFNPGTPVSNWGLQNGTNTGTFAINNTNGAEGISVSVTDNTPTSVDVSGSYTGGGANVAVTRTYELIAGYNVMRITSSFTNNGASSTTLRYFDTFDPDQGFNQSLGFSTSHSIASAT